MTLPAPDDADPTTVVRSLLGAARLTVSADELAGFATMYPTLRAQADALYSPAFEPEAPALHFDPTVGYD
jgi:hypothetical protein